MKYTAVIHPAGKSWNAYVPDLPGCIATAPTRAQVEELIREAIPLYIETLRERDETVPPPTHSAIIVETTVEAA